MKVAFVGISHAARFLAEAARDKGHDLCAVSEDPEIAFISEDTPTDFYGKRDLDLIRDLCRTVRGLYPGPIVLTSQVPPGFTRSLELGLFHQSETLRISDAAERAANPEQIILGTPSGVIPNVLRRYYSTWDCPLLIMTLEESELSKIAINWFLKSQVETTNDLAKVAERVGANWENVAAVLRNDRRIGRHAYLTPGQWHTSPHLVRDARTVRELLR